MIGAASMVLWYTHGKIAGISGIVGRLLTGPRSLWQLAFVVGMLLGGVAYMYSGIGETPVREGVSSGLLIVAGLLVGLGTGIGSGCTSGHGVCGIGRLSARSIVATCIFMAVAAATVFVSSHVIGG
jgi:uncharacterized membrane protein YedE/YeeE